MSSSFGTLFRIHSFGESHGAAMGVIIDGCPAGILLDEENITKQLQRRRPGQSPLTSQRKEKDGFEILSGLHKGKTLGSPIAIIVRNTDIRSEDYTTWGDIYRPSHADYTYHSKYNFRTPIGGGRASVRESVARVIAGALASQILKEELNIITVAWVDAVGKVEAKLFDKEPMKLPKTIEEVEKSIVRCPDEKTAAKMIEVIEKTRKDGDSIGGVLGLVAWNVPPGLGEPVFSKLEAELGRAFLSIPACKGFESGSGFNGTLMNGSEHNDIFYNTNDENSKLNQEQDKTEQVPELKTHTNYSGGIQGGITNGMPLLVRTAFKATATIFHPQKSVNESGEEVTLKAKGRHDPCVLPRAVPIVEAMANLVLLDAYLQQRARNPEWWLRWRR